MLNRVRLVSSRSRIVRGTTRVSLTRQARYSHGKFPRYFGRHGSPLPPSFSNDGLGRGNSLNGWPTLEDQRIETRRRWARWSAVMGTVMATAMGVIWVTFQEDVPMAGGKQFNFISRDWMVRNEASWNLGISNIATVVGEGAVPIPGLLWPDDHPATLVVRKVFNRLLQGSGYDPALWHIDIVNAPTIGRCDVAMSGKAILYSGSLNSAQDEAGLAMILSDALAQAIAGSTSVEASHTIFQWTAAVPAAQLLITSIFLKRLFFLAVPYTYLYAKYLGRYRRSPGYEREFENRTYIAMMAVHRAGYEMEDAFKFAMRNLIVSEALLEDAEGEMMGEMDDDFVDDLRESNRLDKVRIMKMQAWMPEIREKVREERLDKQESKALPTGAYEHPGDFTPSVGFE